MTSCRRGWLLRRYGSRGRVNSRSRRADGPVRIAAYAGAPGHFTGRWYAIRYRSAGTTMSAVSTGLPDA